MSGKLVMFKRLSFLVLASMVLCMMIAPETVEAYSASKANAIIRTANKYLGTPYKFGAEYSRNHRYFDCSSFVQYVYGKHGIDLPRTSRAQAKTGEPVSMRNLKKGDLVFFKASKNASNRITHVAIYAGNNKLLHTYGEGGVKYTTFTQYWKNRYVKARRVL